MTKTSKRKSEGDLPNDHGRSKSKLRKTIHVSDISDVARARDASDDDDGLLFHDSSRPKYVKKSKKFRKSEPVRQKVDEYEEDTGRTESQSFLEIIAHESKKKKQAIKKNNEYVEIVTEVIQEEEQALKDRIQNLTSISLKQNDGFLAAFKLSYAASRPQNGPKAFASLYERSRSINSTALQIIEKFEKINKQTVAVNANQFMTDKWAKDSENITKILRLGRQAGWEKYEKLLLDQEKPEVDEDDEKILSHVYPNFPEGDDLAVAWGKIAKKQVKAAKKMVKATLLERVA